MDPSGWLALLSDMGSYFSQGYGLAAITLAVLGVALHILRSRGQCARGRPVAAAGDRLFHDLLQFCSPAQRRPLSAAASGAGMRLYRHRGRGTGFPARDRMRLLGRGVLLLVALAALHQAVAINAAMLFDPRYDAERWMAAHVKPGDVIETYGQNCFLPRFPQNAQVIRVGQGSLKLRNPSAGRHRSAGNPLSCHAIRALLC